MASSSYLFIVALIQDQYIINSLLGCAIA